MIKVDMGFCGIFYKEGYQVVIGKLEKKLKVITVQNVRFYEKDYSDDLLRKREIWTTRNIHAYQY